MEFDIKELTITLMVGAFTILGFEAILYYFFGKAIIGVFQGTPHQEIKATSEHKLTSLIMLLVFAFGLGIIVENLSLKYVDSDKFPFKTIPARLLNTIDHSIVPELGLPPTDDDRAITLIGNFYNPKPSALAKALARNGAFVIDDTGERGAEVAKWILKPDDDKGPTRCDPLNAKTKDDCAAKDDIEASAKLLYYYAKNTAYSHPDYYDELTRMEHRLTFARSVSFVAFLYTVLAVVLLAFVLIFKRGSGLPLRNSPIKRSSNRAGFHSFREWFGRQQLRPLGVLAIMLAVYLFSIWAYGREADAFNRRAFGYLSTMLISERRQRPKETGESITPTFR